MHRLVGKERMPWPNENKPGTVFLLKCHVYGLESAFANGNVIAKIEKIIIIKTSHCRYKNRY